MTICVNGVCVEVSGAAGRKGRVHNFHMCKLQAGRRQVASFVQGTWNVVGQALSLHSTVHPGSRGQGRRRRARSVALATSMLGCMQPQQPLALARYRNMIARQPSCLRHQLTSAPCPALQAAEEGAGAVPRAQAPRAVAAVSPGWMRYKRRLACEVLHCTAVWAHLCLELWAAQAEFACRESPS